MELPLDKYPSLENLALKSEEEKENEQKLEEMGQKAFMKSCCSIWMPKIDDKMDSESDSGSTISIMSPCKSNRVEFEEHLFNCNEYCEVKTRTRRSFRMNTIKQKRIST